MERNKCVSAGGNHSVGKMLVKCVCVAFLMLRALQHAYIRKRQVFTPAPLFIPC